MYCSIQKIKFYALTKEIIKRLEDLLRLNTSELEDSKTIGA